MSNQQKLKILHIMSGFGGGISSFVRNKAEFVEEANIIFDVATYDECDLNFEKSIENTGGKIYKLLNPKIDGWNSFRESYTNVLKNNNYDIIYCHINGYRVLPYYYYAKKYSDANFYIHAHLNKPLKYLSATEKYQLRIDQIINRRTSDQIVGCGELAIQSVFGKDTPKEKMMVIPNSVEVERFIKTEETSKRLRDMKRSEFGLEDDELVVGHVGRLEAVKNHELTIGLAEYIKENNLRMKILVIGEGNREVELKKLVEQRRLRDIVIFTGRISPIEDFFPALDVMLLPSFAEGLPTVVVEAQASGVPVVMSDTITKEVDLDLNMLEAVSLEEDYSEWVKAIEEAESTCIPDPKVRRNVIKEKSFSNEASADLYINFLLGNISQYTII